jgi:outer membrane protein assembly factor BamD
VIEQFVRLNPGNKNIPYMYYLLALSYYEQIADVRRDQEMTEKALAALRDVSARFPDSDYARDAKLKLDLAFDHLAGKEMEIGRFYQKQGKYISAINRFKAVVQKYETTSHVTEALYRLTETYMALGVVDEAKRYAAVLGHNYPKSKWYSYAYRITEEGKNSPKRPSKPSWIEDALTFEQSPDAYDCAESTAGCKSIGKDSSWFGRLFE